MLIYDSQAPVQTIYATTPSPVTSGGIVDFTVQFNDENLDVNSISLTPDDIFVATTGGTVTVGTVTVSGSGNSWLVELGQVQGVGPLAISSNGTAYDFAGNKAKPGESSVVSINFTPPQCGISAASAASVSGNGAASVSYTVSYSSATFASSNLTAGSINLNTTGTAIGTVGVTGSGTSYTVTITNITGVGTLGISVAGGAALDNAGNSDFGAGPSGTFNVLVKRCGPGQFDPGVPARCHPHLVRALTAIRLM